MVSILPYLKSIPSDLLKPIELKDGAEILDHYILTMQYDNRDLGTIVITPYINEIRIEIRPTSVLLIPNLTVSDMEKRLKNYFNILGLSTSVYLFYKNVYQNSANPYGVLI